MLGLHCPSPASTHDHWLEQWSIVVCRLIHLRLVQYGFNVCLLRFVCDAALDDVDQVLCCRVQMSMILKLGGDGERAVRGVCGLETRDTDGLAMPVCVSGNRL